MTTRTEQRLVAALKKKHGGAAELAERGIMAVGRAQALLKKLHEAGKIRIAGWRRSKGSGPIAPIWSWGKGEDCPRPAPLTNAQRCKRYQDALRKRTGKSYRIVRQAQVLHIPGRTIVVDGKKVYQQ